MKSAHDMARDLKAALGGRNEAIDFIADRMKATSGATSAYWTEVFVAMGNPPAQRRAPAPPASSGSIKPGDTVLFGRPHGEKTKGRVLRVAARTILVETLEGRGQGKHGSAGKKWRVARALVTLAPGGSSAAPPPRPKKRTTSSTPPAATADAAREERQAGTDAWLHAHNQLDAARQRGSKKDIAHWSKTLDKISKANVARLARQEAEFKRETATRVARGKDAVSRPVAEMAEDFRIARAEADQAVAGKSDTGSFNFDYPTIRAERSAAKVAKALKIAGLDSHRGSGMWKGQLLISPPAGTGSQGRRNAWAEAMAKALEARGYFTATFYKMD
jgi:hypothetical protein